MFRLLAVPLLTCLALAIPAAAGATDLVVSSAAALQAALNAALPGYHAANVHITYGTAGEVVGKATAGAPLDIVVLPPGRLKQLVADGHVVAGTDAPLGATEIGVALRDGTKPEKTDTVDGLHAALLSASAIGIANPASGATTGVHLSAMLKQSGWDQQLGNKLRVYPDGIEAMQALARGEIGIAMGQLSEMRPVKGVFETGPVPPSWQLHTVYTGAVTTRSKDPAAAKALLAWLASPQVTPFFQKVGLDRP